MDPAARTGYRFKGTARVLERGERFDEVVRRYREGGVALDIDHVVLVRVEHARALVSPSGDAAATEGGADLHADPAVPGAAADHPPHSPG